MAKRDFKPDALAHRAADQRLELTHQCVHVERLRLQVLAARERQQLLCEALAPLRCVPGCRQVPLQMLIAVDPAAQQVNVSEDNREQVVEVVRDSPGELTNRFHLLRLDQIADHLIDVVLQGRDLSGSLNGNQPCDVPLCNSIRDLAYGANLGRQVVCQLVHVIGQVAPDAGRPRHACLAAELAFGAHLARYVRSLLGKDRESFDHAVDGVGERGDLALAVDSQLAPQITVCDCGYDVGNVPHLTSQVGGHRVHVIGEILPRAGHAAHIGLAAELAFGANLAGHARHFRGERVELVHHRIYGVLQFENFALHVHRDLLRQVALRLRGRHLGDVAHLTGQVGGHQVHVIGEILPRAGHAAHIGLAAELAFSAHFARHAGHFRGERVELIHHRVDGIFQLENFALDVHGDLLRQVALRHRGGHLVHVAHLAGQVRGHGVHVVGKVLPGARHAADLCLATELAFGAHLARHTRDFRHERAELLQHRVHDLADAQKFAAQRTTLDLEIHCLRQVALGHGTDHARHFPGRLHHVADQVVDHVDVGGPRAARVRQLGPVPELALLADNLAEALDFLAHALVELDHIIERVGNFAVESGQVYGKPDREIPLSKCSQSGKKLATTKICWLDYRPAAHRRLPAVVTRLELSGTRPLRGWFEGNVGEACIGLAAAIPADSTCAQSLQLRATTAYSNSRTE